MPTVGTQSVDNLYHVYYCYLVIVQQRHMQEEHPPDNLESPWEDEDHPENYSPLWEYNEVRQENIPPWEDEDQLENDPAGGDYLEEEYEPVPISVFLAIYHDGHEELVDIDEEFVRIMEMSFMEASERLGQESNLEEKTILEHLKTRQYRTSADEDGEICVVCQSEFEAKEVLAALGCRHEYHFDCIKRWLLHKNFCPICKRMAIDQESC